MAHRARGIAALAALTALAVVSILAKAAPSPSPSLATVLARPPAGDFSELMNGTFTAHDFANLNGAGSVATRTEDTLNHYGFVEGYGKTWQQASSGKGLIEAVMAFAGGKGASNALSALEKGDESDASYRHPDTITGISPYYGAHFEDTTNNVFEDFFGFVKGNDVFAILFVSSQDDVIELAVAQARAQYDLAPGSTIPRSQWPENAKSVAPLLVGGLAFAGSVVLIVVVLTVFLVLRRRTPATPDLPSAQAQAEPVQMSPDGAYWWDGHSWRQVAPPPQAN